MGDQGGAMSTYWLITAPADDTKEKTFSKLQTAVRDVASVHKWDLPDLKVGTLDSLMQLSDDLVRMDMTVESMVHKIADMTEQIYSSNAQPGQASTEKLTINEMSTEQFTEKFLWDEGKFQKKSSLRDLVDEIMKQSNRFESTLKEQWTQWGSTVSALQNIQRKAGGNLMVKSLHEIVKEEDFVKSETLTTLLVVVPKYHAKEWMAAYETLAQYVVPRSSKVICEDGDYQLYNVVLFERCVDEFTQKAREKQFTVRDYEFDKSALEASKGEKAKLQNQMENQRGQLLRQVQTAYRVGYGNWMHLKAIRVFVESVLRYGLPANLQTMILRPNKGKAEKVRTVLKKHYAHLGTAAAYGGGTDTGHQDEEFFPYVYLPIKTSAHTTD